MKNITCEGISTLQRLHLCWQIRKQIGKIHQPTALRRVHLMSVVSWALQAYRAILSTNEPLKN